MSYLLIKNGKVVSDGCITKKDILLRDNLIENDNFSGELPSNCNIIDADGKYVSPGFVDIHLHGGGGYDFMDCSVEAFKKGFSHITHLYSATTTVHKVNQVVKGGIVEAAYLDDNVTVELIADGKHAAVDALKLAVKIKGTDKVALVTDALRPAGTDVKESWLGEKIPENRVIIEDGVAKLPDRSVFAGSIATCAMLLDRGVNHYGQSLADTVKMITQTPAKILGAENKGRIKAGLDADIVIFNKDYRIEKVILGGNIVK